MEKFEEQVPLSKQKLKRPANKEPKASYYVKNADLLVEIEKWKETGKMSDELGRMIVKIAHGLSRKGNWCRYTWIEDMISDGVFTVCKYLKNFDTNKSKNPFAYITSILTNAYIGQINYHKKHSKIKKALFDSKVDEMTLEGYTKPNYDAMDSPDNF